MASLTQRNNIQAVARMSIDSSTSSISMEGTSQQPVSPPEYEYEALTESPRLRQKFNVQPREDEGHEKLPPYSCAISLENVFMRKLELEGAVHRAHDRNWYKVHAQLQGTALTFHKFKAKGIFRKLDNEKEQHPDLPIGKKGHFIRSYNLQHADVGIAADYYKKRYVIRVRAETDQFLLSCLGIETFVQWLQSLFAAIDLAPPLDDREIPRDLSIPRPRRRRPCVRVASELTNNIDVEGNAALVREQYEIIRRSYPRLVNDAAVQDSGAGISETAVRNTLSGLEANGFLTASETRHIAARTSSLPIIPPSSPLPELVRSSTAPIPEATSNPSIDTETGKWRPNHQWSAMYDLVYAKRCMAVLTLRSPRKSKYVIIRGKQWIVDWETGALTRVEPPDYGEVEGSFEAGNGGELRIGQYGGLVRI